MATSQDFVNWVCSNRLDHRFLKYALLSERRAFLRFASGTTHQTIYFPEVKAFHICMPRVPEQQAIVHILGALDDKIELNRRTSETLEATARALFKSWFVNFDPVRAKAEGRSMGVPNELEALFPDAFEESELLGIPNGWRVGRIDDVALLNRETVTPLEFPDEIFEHFSIPAFDDGRVPKQEQGLLIRSNKCVVSSDSVLVSKLNPRIPRVWLPQVSTKHRAISSTEFLVLQPRPPVDKAYLYSLLSSAEFMREFETLVTGTSGSHQRVKVESLLQMACIVPPDAVIDAFAGLVRPMLDRMNMATSESGVLAAIRDSLLPKLISGELRVRDGERMLARASNP